MSYSSPCPAGGHSSVRLTSSGARGLPWKGPVAWVKEHITLLSGIPHNPHQHVYPGYCGE